MCLSPTQATRQALFFVGRIARLASYACRVGLDLPSSYVRLEWELDGFDGPTSYCTVLYSAVYRWRWIQTETDGDGDIRKRQQEDNVICIPPPLPYMSPSCSREDTYTYTYDRNKNQPISKTIHPDRRRIRKVSSLPYSPPTVPPSGVNSSNRTKTLLRPSARPLCV